MELIKSIPLIAATIIVSWPAYADDISDLKKEIAQIRIDYENRMSQLEQRLEEAEITTNEVRTEVEEVKATPIPETQSTSSFNPSISMVLNGQFSSYSNPIDNYSLSGFSLQNGAGLATEGFSLGESEITLTASVDQLFWGQASFSLADTNGDTEIGTEEAFIETLGLNNGITVRAGRFFSPIGYLNQRHAHAWNFSDAPLIYRGLFGNQLATDGVKLSYILPTDQFIELGGTAGSGNNYPGSNNHSGIGDWLMYAKTGGDLGISHSWLASISRWESSPEDRDIGNGDSSVSFSGDTDISNISLVYKWAPNGNPTQRNFSLYGEYFYQHDQGHLSNIDTTAYNSKQYGTYVEGVYQFIPHWRTSLRYDWLGSNIDANNQQFLTDANLDDTNFHPYRYSLMLEWLPSEFSRLRGQINYDKSSPSEDIQLFLQYTVSVGAHGVHSY